MKLVSSITTEMYMGEYELPSLRRYDVQVMRKAAAKVIEVTGKSRKESDSQSL
jgi:hypothetical protein